MSKENTIKYYDTISELKERYRDKIKILCGIEQDYYSDMPTDQYDFVIGSVHYVKVKGYRFPIDESADIFRSIINDYFNGDVNKLILEYYRTVKELVMREDVDVIGHFDLIRKFNENGTFFDEDSPKYKRIASSVLSKAVEANKVIEINTGAMSRGYLTDPYPAQFSSDSHKKTTLNYGFGTAEAIALRCGFSTNNIVNANNRFIEKL